MKKKQKLLSADSGNGDAIPVCFQCLRPQAKAVYVAGSFNNWEPTATSMKSQGDGQWKTELVLAPGRYEYRFVADGEWLNDAAAELVPNPFGTANCLLVVGLNPTTPSAPAVAKST